ncbi:MAG: DUF2306 domain-containing protein [Psychrosphaera sp.]|nr:DUF2306 domain-containing protein [Psychrosphaera sp.]
MGNNMINTSMINKSMRGLLMVVIGFLCISGIGAAIFYFFRTPNNPGFIEFSLTTQSHVILGGLFLALAPFQLIKRVRSRWPLFHRWSGRLLVFIGGIIALTALFMAVVIPFSGWLESVINSIFALFFLLSLVKGLYYIRRKQVDLHRQWMIRAFAVGLGPATMRLIFVPALIIAGQPTHEQIMMLSIVSFTVAFSVHIAFAEWWIRGFNKSKKREQPAEDELVVV